MALDPKTVESLANCGNGVLGVKEKNWSLGCFSSQESVAAGNGMGQR